MWLFRIKWKFCSSVAVATYQLLQTPCIRQQSQNVSVQVLLDRAAVDEGVANPCGPSQPTLGVCKWNWIRVWLCSPMSSVCAAPPTFLLQQQNRSGKQNCVATASKYCLAFDRKHRMTPSLVSDLVALSPGKKILTPGDFALSKPGLIGDVTVATVVLCGQVGELCSRPQALFSSLYTFTFKCGVLRSTPRPTDKLFPWPPASKGSGLAEWVLTGELVTAESPVA